MDLFAPIKRLRSPLCSANGLIVFPINESRRPKPTEVIANTIARKKPSSTKMCWYRCIGLGGLAKVWTPRITYL